MATRVSTAVLGILRRSALDPSTKSFICRRCLHNQGVPQTPSLACRDTAFLRAFKSPLQNSIRQASSASAPATLNSPLASLGRSIGVRRSPAKLAGFFPTTNHKNVAYWLLGSAASVFGIVIFGGLTRLTESGLSITEWKPVTGSVPPTNQEMWEAEFELYKASPEFKQLNSRMTLEEFKQIYWMEWIHRLWGRIVGVTFVVPTIYFIARRRVTARMALNLTAICGLIGFQGFIGWWMVKSGLKDDLFAPGSHPRVSQYRLTAHLGTAFICYLAMFWNGITILQEKIVNQHRPKDSMGQLSRMAHPKLKTLRRSVGALLVLVFITAMSGGLVAGLDAGLIYNEFPFMGLGLTPPKKELFDPFYSHTSDQSDLWWRNMLENPSLVQLDHRVLATTTFTAVCALWAYARFVPSVRNTMTRRAKRGTNLVFALVWAQATLGITTLIYLVPLPLASAHQAGALALLTATMYLGRHVWIPKRLIARVTEMQVMASRQHQKGRITLPPTAPRTPATTSPSPASGPVYQPPKPQVRRPLRMPRMMNEPKIAPGKPGPRRGSNPPGRGE
ncbi:COX15-CtaA-domain-containing protein [Myriangium duriaei CBS 260.36]|uniref:COX15-CtaA-domain-containing protein n=1 Tax=Myriangium duriaei CBS 260.36 TaxID=1168546 RepID=A0A9P4J1B3_9PEZI|nr:COX15-CtaA-domain-containing protein [Myriangium duriaei CBS 260.36]